MKRRDALFQRFGYNSASSLKFILANILPLPGHVLEIGTGKGCFLAAMVALGIAVAQRCEPCINLHVQKSLEAGNSPAEILEAASVAVMMPGGPAYTHIPVVIDALEALAPKT